MALRPSSCFTFGFILGLFLGYSVMVSNGAL